MSNVKVSHNACSVPHYIVSYWLSIDRGSFPVTDFIGEFSIIDPAFQLETYGNFLHSDRSFVENYAVRRIFFDIENHLPAHLENVPHSFSVLNKCHVVSSHDTVFNCRCHFNSSEDPLIPNIDFDISLTVVKG